MKPWHYIELALALLFVGSYVYLWRKYVLSAQINRDAILCAAGALKLATAVRDVQACADDWQAEVQRLRVLEDALRNVGWNGEPIHDWLAMRLFPLPNAKELLALVEASADIERRVREIAEVLSTQAEGIYVRAQVDGGWKS
ncbi:MAG TPA: hypothetical protein VIK52_14180, partial [Opitutaceae bacterium]